MTRILTIIALLIATPALSHGGRDFWVQYFEAAGVSSQNIEYTAELDQH